MIFLSRFSFFAFLIALSSGFIAQKESNLSILLKKCPIGKSTVLHVQTFVDGRFEEFYSESKKIEDSLLEFSVATSKIKSTSLIKIHLDEGVNSLEFIYNPTESEITIESFFWGLKNGDASILNSRENDAYSRLIQTTKEFHEFEEEFYQESLKHSIFDSNYKEKIALTESKFEQLQHLYNINLEKIEILFPKTFTADVLIPLAKIPVRNYQVNWKYQYDSYLSFLHVHFFDYVPFANSSILNHYALQDKLTLYLTSYTEKSTIGIEKSIDKLLSLSQSNTEVHDFMYNFLLRTFLEAKNEHFIEYLTHKHANGCSLNLSAEELTKLQNIQSSNVGSKIADLLLYDTHQEPKSLLKTTQKNQLTIVYFWLSWCSKCSTTTPQIEEVYRSYKKKGFEVFAVSLDKHSKEWKEALTNHPTEWVNVAELVPLKSSKVIPLYNLSSTPSIYLVDSEGTIVAKNIFGDDLKNFVSEFFK